MIKTTITPVRALSLDALRGIAILMMILSAMEPFGGILPGWMYHAQCPPPTHAFNPDCPGITWVDLVFPFFIFSMGAAIPFALSGRRRKGLTDLQLLVSTGKRFGLLAFFAFGTYYIRPWAVNVEPTYKWLIALMGFFLFFMAFGRFSQLFEKRVNSILNNTGLVAIAATIYLLDHMGWVVFSLNSFDIIIMILACLALFGQAIWIIPGSSTKKYLVIALMMLCFFLSAKLQDGWTASLWTHLNLAPFVTWEYMKYLVVMLPGMIAGELMREHLGALSDGKAYRKVLWGIVVLGLGMVLNCLITLYLRKVELGFFFGVMFSVGLLLLARKCRKEIPLLWHLLLWGVGLVLAGFLLESLQGGIKKDPASISYLVLTPGLAFITLASLYILIDVLHLGRGFRLLLGAGQNPMLAYLAGSNLVFASFMVTGLNGIFFEDLYPVWGGLTRALAITLLTGWISGIAARNKVFWKS